MAVCHCGRDMNYVDGQMVCPGCGYSYEVSKKPTYDELLLQNIQLKKFLKDFLDWEEEALKNGYLRKQAEQLLEKPP